MSGHFGTNFVGPTYPGDTAEHASEDIWNERWPVKQNKNSKLNYYCSEYKIFTQRRNKKLISQCCQWGVLPAINIRTLSCRPNCVLVINTRVGGVDDWMILLFSVRFEMYWCGQGRMQLQKTNAEWTAGESRNSCVIMMKRLQPCNVNSNCFICVSGWYKLSTYSVHA